MVFCFCSLSFSFLDLGMLRRSLKLPLLAPSCEKPGLVGCYSSLRLGCARPRSLCTHLLSRVGNGAQPVDVQQPLQLLAQHTQRALKRLLLLR